MIQTAKNGSVAEVWCCHCCLIPSEKIVTNQGDFLHIVIIGFDAVAVTVAVALGARVGIWIAIRGVGVVRCSDLVISQWTSAGRRMRMKRELQFAVGQWLREED